MKLSYDKEADALTICLRKGKIVKDKELSENVFAGYSQSNELIEIQILDISESDRPYLTAFVRRTFGAFGESGANLSNCI